MVNVVIMESPNKVKTVSKYLGKDYECIASWGHCIDLPPRKFAVDIKNDFAPTYEVLPDKKKTVSAILSKVRKADMVYLLTDPDREGEAMAWHLINKFSKKVKYKRAKSNEINKAAILEALQNAGDIDLDLVESYETRRILDRLVGYKCSYPVKMATGGISVGRVQSAGLRILGERELEIRNFKPEDYWVIEGTLLSPEKEEVFVSIKKPKPLDIKSEESAKEILAEFETGPITVSRYESKTATKKASPPFKTSTYQQAASTYLGFGSKKAMTMAQKLFEAGHITYHRTDSITLAKGAIDGVRAFIKDNLDKKYLPSKPIFYKTKSKQAQEGHEAIRPTNLARSSITGDKDLVRAYDLIWRRTISSQMTPAKFARRSADFKAKESVLNATGSRLLFDGYQKIWTYASAQDRYLPDLTEGDVVTIKELKSIAKQTKPPPRYKEASFIKRLEEEGIGRPATYTSVIETLKARDYIKIESRSIFTTDLGLTVLDFLIKVNFCFSDIKFSSLMEEKLDQIASGDLKKLPTLTDFWGRLAEDLKRCEETRKQNSITEYDCPKCKKHKLAKKHSRWGAFYGCSGHPECKNIMNIGPNGEPVEKKPKEKKKLVLSDYDCPKCDAKMVEREGRYGKFYGCSTFPKCRGMRKENGEESVPRWKKKAAGAKKKTAKKKTTTKKKTATKSRSSKKKK